MVCGVMVQLHDLAISAIELHEVSVSTLAQFRSISKLAHGTFCSLV